MAANPTLTFRFEGIGLDSSESTAADFQYKGSPSHGLAALVEPPRSIDTKIDPLSGDVSFSSFSPTFRYGKPDPDAANQVATTFLHRDRSGVADLDSDISPTDTVLDIGISGLDNDVVHIGTEAIKLGTEDAGSYGNCTRDYWGVTNGIGATAHDAGDVIYQEPPFWKGRVVELHVLRGTETENAQWLGIVRNVRTGSKGAKLTVECDALWSTWLNRRLAQKMAPIEPRSHQVKVDKSPSTSSTIIEAKPYFGSEYETQVMKPDSWQGGEGGEDVAIQVGDAAFVSPGAVAGVPAFIGGENSLDSGEYDYNAPVNELCVYGTEIVTYSATATLDESPVPTRNRPQPHHPVRIANAHMASTSWRSGESGDDVLQGTWGLALAGQTTTPDLSDTSWMTVDHLIYGWDGEGPTAAELINLCRRWGWLTAIQSDGTLDYSRWGMPTVGNLSDAYTLDPIHDDFTWDAGYSREVTNVSATVGNLPFQQGREVNLDVVDRPQPDWEKGESVKWEYPEVAKDNDDVIESLAIGEVEKLKSGFVLITCWADAPANLSGVSGWNIGDWVQINSFPPNAKWAVNQTGSRDKPDGSNEWLAQIIGTRQDLVRDRFQLHLLLPRTEIVRWRSPAMNVTAFDEVGGDRCYCRSSSEFGYDDTDNQAFDVGDEIRVHNPDGSVAQSTVYEIDDIGDGATGPYINIAGTFDSNPTGGVIRLANYDDWSNADTALSGVDRPWMYLADSDHTIGTDDDAGDVYGR